MIPFAYVPPPRPVAQIVVQQPAPVASKPEVRKGFKPPEFRNRRERRAYRAAVLRRVRHTLFSKTAKRAMPQLVSVVNCRAELKGLL